LIAVLRFEAISAVAVPALLPVAKVPVVALEHPFEPALPAVTPLQTKLLAVPPSVRVG
jgi:hypothetical protein